MRKIGLDNITSAAVASFGGLPDARQRLLVQQFVAHLHQFAKDVQLTHDEWRGAIGFLHRAVPRERLGAESEAFARHLAGLAPLAVRAMKQILGGIARGDVDSASASRLAQECAQSRDLQEGLAAQREKRAPRFTGE